MFMISRIIKAIGMLYIKKAGPEAKIKYFRKQGMRIGKDCRLDTVLFSTEPYLITLGDNVAIGPNTAFITHDASIRCFADDFPDDDIFGEIIVGSNVFIGQNCTVLLNTRIGNNCIIGAGSVVRGNFPDNSIILGNPAMVVTNMKVMKLLVSQNRGRLPTGKMSDPEKKPLIMKHFNKLI